MPVPELYEQLKANLGKVVPDFELRLKAEVAEEVLRLKQERNAVILAHNYMEPALFHSVPDFQGDSLELSRKAAETEADIIIFCGVRFMAETAKILSPEKTVLLPAEKAGCSLAASITAEDVRGLKDQFPGVPVVTYVNTYADVKAESDICCTSSNAAAVVESMHTDTVIFLPDDTAGLVQVMQWLAVAENECLYGMARARAVKLFGRPWDMEQSQALGRAGLEVLDGHLTGNDWLAAGRPTIADVACYPYVALAPEGEIPLAPYGNVIRWIGRIQALPGYVSMPGIAAAAALGGS